MNNRKFAVKRDCCFLASISIQSRFRWLRSVKLVCDDPLVTFTNNSNILYLEGVVVVCVLVQVKCNYN